MNKKLYAVIWTEEARKAYGVPKNELIVCVEPKEDIHVLVSKHKIGRPKYLTADVLAIFRLKEEAVAFIDGNDDWIIKELLTK